MGSGTYRSRAAALIKKDGQGQDALILFGSFQELQVKAQGFCSGYTQWTLPWVLDRSIRYTEPSAWWAKAVWTLLTDLWLTVTSQACPFRPRMYPAFLSMHFSSTEPSSLVRRRNRTPLRGGARAQAGMLSAMTPLSLALTRITGKSGLYS